MALSIDFDDQRLFKFWVKTETGSVLGAGMTAEAAWKASAEAMDGIFKDIENDLDAVIKLLQVKEA